MIRSLSFLIILLLTVVSVEICHAQAESNTGPWTGIFMEQFSVVLKIVPGTGGDPSGSLRMYSHGQLLQDDTISSVRLQGDSLYFTIPDKLTYFAGFFTAGHTKLTGEFIFPDSSRHPLFLQCDEIIPGQGTSSSGVVKHAEANLTEDLSFLYTRLKEHHPAPFEFTSERSLDELYFILREQLHDSMSTVEFYTLASKLTDLIRCSHTGLRLPLLEMQMIHVYGSYFPLQLFFYDRRSFVISSVPGIETPIPVGVEVISINDIAMTDIISRMLSFFPGEACNLTGKYHALNREFNTYFQYLNDSDSFMVEYLDATGITRITIPSVSYSLLQEYSPTHGSPRVVEYSEIPDKSLSILRVPTFGIDDMGRYFSILESTMQDIKQHGIQYLILDLRDNEGGHPIFSAQLLSYLVDQEFTYFSPNGMLGDFEPLYHPMQPNESHFDGNLFVLVNGGCLSTTGHLISLLDYYTDAVFIGEEPGSTYRCCDYSMQFTLPHTGLELNVPRAVFETAVSGHDPCSGFQVDLMVGIKVSDLIAGKDPYLDAILSLDIIQH